MQISVFQSYKFKDGDFLPQSFGATFDMQDFSSAGHAVLDGAPVTLTPGIYNVYETAGDKYGIDGDKYGIYRNGSQVDRYLVLLGVGNGKTYLNADLKALQQEMVQDYEQGLKAPQAAPSTAPLMAQTLG